jgi:hypothetical protein
MAQILVMRGFVALHIHPFGEGCKEKTGFFHKKKPVFKKVQKIPISVEQRADGAFVADALDGLPY